MVLDRLFLNNYFKNMLYLSNLIPKGILSININSISPVIFNITSDINNISLLMYIMWAHINTQTKMFSDQLISDHPNNHLRFISIYNILSLVYNSRFIFKVLINNDNILASVTNLYTCASWFERESWDLFGIFFFYNLDLRRILNDYGFSGHPLRKDFPLSGFYETSFSYILGVIRYDSIKITQEFRFFNINSSWKVNTIV